MGIYTYPKQVYAIQHNVTRRIYVGSSENVANRYQAHISLLRSGKHYNKGMQADFDKYGENYGLFILDDIEDYDERKKEYEWMLELGTTDSETGYNSHDERIVKLMRTKPPFKEGVPVPLLGGSQ